MAEKPITMTARHSQLAVQSIRPAGSKINPANSKTLAAKIPTAVGAPTPSAASFPAWFVTGLDLIGISAVLTSRSRLVAGRCSRHTKR